MTRHVAIGFLIMPQDRAFFRRPEPFRAAAESVVESEGPKPWTVAGCVRNALLRTADGDLREVLEYPRKLARSTPPESIGDALEETALFLGTWVVEVRPETPDRIERVWWPRPAHLVKYEPEGEEEEEIDLLRVEEVGGAAIAHSHHDTIHTRRYGFRTPKPPRPGSDVEAPGRYVDAETVPQILAGRAPKDVNAAEAGELLHPELHVGVKLTRTKTVEEGHLYATRFLRPGQSHEDVRTLVGFLTVLIVPEDAWDEGVLRDLPSPDGRLGRGRHAWVIPLRAREWMDGVFPEVGEPEGNLPGLYLETPTPFPTGNARSSAPESRLRAEAVLVRPGSQEGRTLTVELEPTELDSEVLADRVPGTRRVSTWSGKHASPDHLAAVEGSVLALKDLKINPGTPLFLFPTTKGEDEGLLASRLAFHLSGVGTAYVLSLPGAAR
ncbi:MAG: type III-B CRISPR module-associated protein Cmr3 [Euryarchaeota archaeon]